MEYPIGKRATNKMKTIVTDTLVKKLENVISTMER
jgi:hypothetical protein